MKIFNLIMKESQTFPSPLMGEGKGGGENILTPPTLILPHKGGGKFLCCLPIDSEGISVLFLVIAMLLMVTIGYVFSYLIPTKQKSVVFPIQSNQAFFIAQSGVEFAVQYASDNCWKTPTALLGLNGAAVYRRNLGAGRFTINYTDTTNTLTSFGEVPIGIGTERRRIVVSSFTSFLRKVTFIQEAEVSSWITTTSPKTTPSFSVLANDVLVAFGMSEDRPITLAISDSSGMTWTLQQSILVAGYCPVYVWTAVVPTNRSITVTFTRTGGGGQFGGNVLTFRNSCGIGASSKTNVASGAPTLNLTTTQANSAVVVANGDWVARDGTSRAWRTNAGAFTELSYASVVGVSYTIYGGFHADAGATGTYAVGLSAPTAQKYAIVAVEIK